MKLRLKELRLEADMTKKAVAAACGVHPSTQLRRELGQQTFPVSELAVYARIFGCHPADIIDGPHVMSALDRELSDAIKTLHDDQKRVLAGTIRSLGGNSEKQAKSA